MKKIYAALLVAFAGTTAATAQVKLLTTMLSPTNNQAVVVGTPFNFKVEFKNTGNTGIVATDTLLYAFTGSSSAYYRTGMTKAVGDTILINTQLTFSSAPNGTQQFCVLGYIFRAGARTESGADTADNRACKNIVISGGSSNAVINVFSDESRRESLNIAPNPASSFIRLAYTVRTSGKVTARILDVTGREVLAQDFGTQYPGATDFRMDVSKLAPGLYTVELAHDNVRAIGRMMRQ